MDVSYQSNLHVQRMRLRLLKAASIMAIFRGSLKMILKIPREMRSRKAPALARFDHSFASLCKAGKRSKSLLIGVAGIQGGE